MRLVNTVFEASNGCESRDEVSNIRPKIVRLSESAMIEVSLSDRDVSDNTSDAPPIVFMKYGILVRE